METFLMIVALITVLILVGWYAKYMFILAKEIVIDFAEFIYNITRKD
jgi:hypothetical protein